MYRQSGKHRVTERARARKGEADKYRKPQGQRKRKRLSVKYIKYKIRMLEYGLMLANMTSRFSIFQMLSISVAILASLLWL